MIQRWTKRALMIVAENIYGSFCKWWIINPKNEQENIYCIRKIKERQQQIVRSFESMVLQRNSSIKYLRTIFEYLSDAVSINNTNHYGYQVVGLYTGNNVDSCIVKLFPFEIANSIDSTIARLHTLLKWNLKTSCPWSIRQTSFSDLFGFKVKDLKHFYSKYKHTHNNFYRQHLNRDKTWRKLLCRE